MSDTLGTALDAATAALNSVLVLPDHGDTALALWSAASHLGRASDYYPRLAIIAATENAGKTTALRAVSKLGHKGKLVSNITGAGLFRYLDASVKDGTTVLLDEADNLDLEDSGFLRAIINAGVEQDGGVVIRCVGDDHVPVEFDVRGWIALAQVGMVEPATVRSRCIVLSLTRATVPPARRLDPITAAEFAVIGERLKNAVTLDAKEIIARDPKLPAAISNRSADKWRRLVALADCAGGRWPEAARAAAVAMCKADGEPEKWTPTALVLDALEQTFIRTKGDEISLTDIRTDATESGVDEATDPRWLGRKLAGLGLVSSRVRGGLGRYRVYTRANIEQALRLAGRLSQGTVEKNDGTVDGTAKNP